MALLIFSVVCIMALIGKKQTKLFEDAHPVAAYFLIWIAILWLTLVEGGQASLVGLAPVNRELYKDSHPIAYKCSALGHKGDNLERYLLGRQFMVVLVVFCVNISGSPIEGAKLWNFPQWIIDIFFVYGGAMILFTCMVGQLNTQVNASLCMLDYTNSYFALFTLWVAMLIEFTGILHVSYLMQTTVAKLAGNPIISKEEPRDWAQNIFFYGRCLCSFVILGYSFAVTLKALFDGNTSMWEGFPPEIAVVIFFLLMAVVGTLEGMQIAFYAVAKIPSSERGDSIWAKKICHLLYSGDGTNLPAFMVGRQLCVVSCMLFIARVTSVKVQTEEEDHCFHDVLYRNGFFGAFLTTIVASISWQLLASTFPIAFLSNPITYILLRWCLLLEATGICRGAWVLAAIHKQIAGFQRDEVYIGTAESRHTDNNNNYYAPHETEKIV